MTDQRAPTSYGRGVTELDKPTGMYLLDTKEGIAKYMAMSDDQRRDAIVEREADLVAYRNAMVLMGERVVELGLALNEANEEKKKLRSGSGDAAVGVAKEAARRIDEERRGFIHRVEMAQHALDRLGLTVNAVCAIDDASDEDEVDRILKPYLAKKRGKK